VSEDDLRSLLVAAATRLEGAETAATASATELRLDGLAFAALDEAGASFRLRPEVARAALRTPDAVPSPRGRGWIAFAPATLDHFARDRATAWLESAWRLADETLAGEGPSGEGADPGEESNAPPA
jgi:hypothetical protein